MAARMVLNRTFTSATFTSTVSKPATLYGSGWGKVASIKKMALTLPTIPSKSSSRIQVKDFGASAFIGIKSPFPYGLK
eukprot:CAMPEP_0185765928 /NCGR_PEP_ID=MMETSP1174-20130828/33489_1 /TAXON_ID=35687 /ORGANISM="Dictyocha speculum, Strain CCMP1381" /LENGTH=77 /DNA_ID=CAMNT_0028449359 /DNA_START=6 /DNA_END=239 /DNA_ORIENTATION=+